MNPYDMACKVFFFFKYSMLFYQTPSLNLAITLEIAALQTAAQLIQLYMTVPVI